MIQITKSGNTATALFTGSDFYLYGEGQIVFPVGSLSVVIDESDFVTFRKAPCNDVLFSAPMSQIEIDGTALTRENAPTLLDSIIGTPSGGGTPSGDYATTAQLEESELVTAAALNDLNTRVETLEEGGGGGTGLTANIVECTQAEYEAMSEHAVDTIYVISDAELAYYTASEVDNELAPINNSITGLSSDVDAIEATIGDINDALDAINGDNNS